VELEPEVQAWLAGLNDRDFGRVDFLVGLLPSMRKTLASPMPVIWAGRYGS